MLKQAVVEDQLYRLNLRRLLLEGNWKTMHEILLLHSRIPIWPDPAVVNVLKISILLARLMMQVG